MPMRKDDGRLALIQNGEIYNYLELRDELRRLGRSARMAIRVILRAYER
jgi:asparagine synthase (glutamine-hydrolysing)